MTLRISALVVWTAALVSAVLFVLHFLYPASTPFHISLALLVFSIALLATQSLPEHITALIIFLGAILLYIAPPEVVFSGFATGGLWLVFSGIIIGISIQETRLGSFIARRLLQVTNLTYMRAVSVLTIVSFVLGFLMPATIPRLIILIPIGAGLAEAMNLQSGGKGYTGFMLAVILGTFSATPSIMTANLPTIVHIGAMEAVYGQSISFTQFLFYHAPVVSFVRILSIIVVVRLMFYERVSGIETSVDIDNEPITRDQRKLLILLLITLVFWSTDFIHHIKPAWVGLALAIILLLPSTNLLSKDAFTKKANFAPLFFIAGVLAIGAIIKHTGLDGAIGAYLFSKFQFNQGYDFQNYYIIIVLSVLGCLLTTAPALPALTVPLAQQISEQTGFGLMTVLMIQVFGLTGTIFPYQAPPLAFSLGICKISVSNLTKGLTAMLLSTLVIIAPLNYIWWKMIGLFP